MENFLAGSLNHLGNGIRRVAALKNYREYKKREISPVIVH